MAFEDRIRLPSLNLIHRRSRLLNLLTHFVEIGQRLITIYAPGGYGKSILLADFAQTTDLPVCWCSLEPADRDPTSFLTLLAYSITDRFHEIDPDSLLKLVQRGDTQASVRRITDVLADVGPHLIIVDDYHKAVSAGMTLALNRLLDQLPSTSTMIIAARGDMHLETGQILDLLISERASGLSEEELRFTGEELQRVIRKRFGRQIDLETADDIARATSGNIAQILMAGHTQSVQAGRLIGRLSQRLGSDQEVIYGYLASEVFDKQPPELQQFLLYTSILPDMTAELCDKLLETTTAQTTIEELVKRDLFIAQIGAGFRYHDLFAEFLRNKLVQDKSVYQQVSFRAAKLLEERARFEEAITLYLSVQAWNEAAALLEMEGRHFYDTGRALTLHHWLTQIPESELAQHPRLLLLQGQILNNDLGQSELAMAFYLQAEDQFLYWRDLIGAAEGQVWRASALRMAGRTKDSLTLVTSGLNQLTALKADEHLIAWATRQYSLVHSTMGDTTKALSALRQALDLFESLGDTYHIGMCHHDIGVCLEKQGNISGADHHYMQALRIWEAINHANALANTLNSLGVCCYLKGNYDEALKRFQESLDIALQIGATRRAAFAQAGIGDTYLGKREYDRAIEAHTISTKFAREAGVRSLEVYNLVKMGESFYQQHDFIQALNLTNQAREIASEMGLVFEQGIAYALQAQIYTQRGEYRAASKHFAIAMDYLAGADALEQAKVRLWWGYNLLLDLRTNAAGEQLQEAIRLALTMGEVRQGLGAAVTNTQPLLLHFLHRADTPAATRDNIYLLLQQSREKVELSKPSLQVFAFGPPTLIVAGQRRQFTQRSGIPKGPEFLLYLLLQGQEGGCRWSEVSAALWPDLDTDKASRNFHQILKRLRDVILEGPDYILRQDDYYQINSAYLHWCDALAFETLFNRAGRTDPAEAVTLQLELIALYQGEFLAGFELGEWGAEYRASCENRFLQTVKLAGEHLLKNGSPQESLAVLHKGLAVDYFQEDLHRLTLSAYARLGYYDRLTTHYTELCATFKTEFGELPERETHQLYQHLLAGRPKLMATAA